MSRPVVSVGNLSVGGRGKTPTVALLARFLIAAGETPAILSRGYGRRDVADGVVVVSDGTRILADLARSGDEPLLLATDVPGAAVLVCEDRALAGTLAERALGATVHVLDDGFQHRRLARDIDIVLITRADLRDRRLPFGRLREPVSALRRADAVIIDGDTDASGLSSLTSGRVFTLRRSLGRPTPLDLTAGWPDQPTPVVAVAGIAQPDRFFTMLEARGWAIARTLAFPDHHRYSAHDVRRMADVVRESGARGVLTTTKDAMRLLPLAPWPMPIAAMPLDVSIEPADVFRSWLFERLREARA